MPQSSPQKHLEGSKENETEKWWNEYPLDGDPKRPAVILTNLLSKSPRLIGWDDERIERRARAALPKGADVEEEEEIHLGPKREVVNEVAFGLLSIAAKEVTKHLLQREGTQDGAELEDGADSSRQPEVSLSPGVNETQVEETGAELMNVVRTKDEQTIRETELYKLALRSLQWQRDNYLVGRSYADERKAERRRHLTLLTIQPNITLGLPLYPLPYDGTALGNQQIVRLGQWFIPSPIVHRALLPLVVGLPFGQLNQPIRRATVNLIPMSQANLDYVIKSRLLWFLKDDNMRNVMKHSTHNYIANTYRDSASGDIGLRG